MSYVSTRINKLDQTSEYLESYFDDFLDRDDIPSMPQTYRLVWGQTLVALLHHLQKGEVHHQLLSAIQKLHKESLQPKL